MLNRTIKYRSITLIVLICITLFTYFALPDNTKPKIDKDLFKPSDIAQIDRVSISSADEKIELTFNSGRWMLNETLIADRQKIQVLFATIDQAIPKRKAAINQLQELNNQFENNSFLVQLFQADVLQKEFHVWGDDEKKLTWFRAPDGEDIYQVIIPGYSAFVAFIFQQPEHEWRDKLIFDFNWQNFTALNFNYANNSGEDFEISMSDGYFRVKDLAKTDTTRLNDYLDYISMLETMKWLVSGEDEQSDELAKQTADALITITNIAGRSRQLELWSEPLVNNQRLARLDAEQLLWLRTSDLQFLLRRRQDFQEANME